MASHLCENFHAAVAKVIPPECVREPYTVAGPLMPHEADSIVKHFFKDQLGSLNKADRRHVYIVASPSGVYGYLVPFYIGLQLVSVWAQSMWDYEG